MYGNKIANTIRTIPIIDKIIDATVAILAAAGGMYVRIAYRIIPITRATIPPISISVYTTALSDHKNI